MSTAVDGAIRILLVEDNPNDARLIRRHLEGSASAFLPDSVNITHTETLDDGVDAWKRDPYDLVLLDLGLPATSGEETFDVARERFGQVPVVVLTNLSDEETAVKLLQRGAQDYINKGSLSRDNLVRSVRYAIEREQRERALRTKSEQLEVLNRILRHDVQNDLQALQGWSSILVEKVADEHEADVRRILRNAEHIQELTENSRAFMRVVTEESDIDVETLRLDELLRDELAKARSIHSAAVFDAPEEFPPVTVAANGMLSSVFRNLLNNAVQHGGDNPRVDVSLDDTAAETVRVTIADDGPGVPDEQKDEIFGRGERGLESEGTGIGLYLVDTLVSKFDGDVWVEDRQNGGSGAVFIVELPTASEDTEWMGGE
jgi:signal transduction histidine kinase